MVKFSDMGEEFLEAYRAYRRADYQLKKDRYIQNSQKYYSKHKEKYQAYGREYYHNKNKETPQITCECGKPIKPTSMPHHKKSKFHQRYIEEKAKIEEAETKNE